MPLIDVLLQLRRVTIVPGLPPPPRQLEVADIIMLMFSLCETRECTIRNEHIRGTLEVDRFGNTLLCKRVYLLLQSISSL